MQNRLMPQPERESATNRQILDAGNRLDGADFLGLDGYPFGGTHLTIPGAVFALD